MPTYKIKGIDVEFPFEAYDCQIAYMEKVIQSLQNRCNALLESPTGTGKTLCLLCATLAWRHSLDQRGGRNVGGKHSDDSSSQSESSKLPTIVYTTRTHSQLRQVIQEFKRTSYRLKMVVLGSREQLCIHEEVSQLHGKTQTNACHTLRKKSKKRYCAHYPRVTEFMKKNPGLGDEPFDIEDLVNIGRSCGPCPYYVSRELHKVVDILFAPYNYLIDRGYRKSLSIEWNNCVLIFDEAHNLESLCADAASFDLTSGLLTACISEAQTCADLCIERREKSNDKSCNPDNFAILRALLLKLEKRIAEMPIESKELGFTKPGPYIYELLADLNVTRKTASMLIDIIEEATLLLEEDSDVTVSGVSHKSKGTVCRLESMGDILKLIFKDGDVSHAKYYQVHVQEAEARAPDVFKAKTSRTLSWWCFNPGIAMEEFPKLGVGSIILTSGTLSPMDSFAEELKLEFPVRLENPHVIAGDQIWAGVVPIGPSGFPLNSSYRSRDSLEYKLELGNAIVNFARIVPDGLLVFFPSYYLLDQCIGCWKDMSHDYPTNFSTIWERICKHKQPVVEPRQSSVFRLSIDDYMAKLKDTSMSGAVFFAVCRGKVSEGLDFADHAGRAVVITGMPFATRTDPKVRLKREYLDQQARSQQIGSKVLVGEEWYSQQALRAVNQAVGRVIRHRHDYGAIIFCDDRFTHSNRQSKISLWIQPHMKCYSKFGDVVFSLTRFFRDGAARGPTKKELARTEDWGNLYGLETIQPVNKLHIEKFIAPLTRAMDPACSNKLLSSKDRAKRHIFGHVGEILPANRSFLTSDKQNQNLTLKHSSDLLTHEKKLLIPGTKNLPHSNHEIVDLTTDALSDKRTCEEVIAPCSWKKARFGQVGMGVMLHCENSPEHSPVDRKAQSSVPFFINESVKVKHEDTQVFEHGNIQNAHGVLSNSVPHCDEEKKGSSFLIQVQEKLTDLEYKEFVGAMKALKSKAMKIGHVLQTIATLFSAPDRLSLFQRFKDYIPAKYHSLYDHYLKTSDDAVGP
ncbi:unnamed protein product [Ilex paraguariensis]|uniref:Regulator of telomere elongation helicase 1 homolog n=1 Tax=Ilex paraguariensis TaxID=185542 RepID=A0ABC8UX39_9AQUA